MNQDILAGKWKQMRGQLKGWWGQLTDDDLDKVEGKVDRLIGVLQEKYGYAREQAEEEVRRRLERRDPKRGEEAGARRSGARALRYRKTSA